MRFIIHYLITALVFILVGTRFVLTQDIKWFLIGTVLLILGIFVFMPLYIHKLSEGQA